MLQPLQQPRDLTLVQDTGSIRDLTITRPRMLGDRRQDTPGAIRRLYTKPLETIFKERLFSHLNQSL
jgi:hypothetical protein